MRLRRTATLIFSSMTLVVLAACGESGSSGGGGGDSSGGGEASGDACAPISGENVVLLEDDLGLQQVDNIIPAVNAAVATPPLLDALNAVSAALTTEDLINLNAEVDLQFQTVEDTATAFVEEKGLAEGLSGGSGDIVIGAAGFTENLILGQMYAQVLTAAGFSATVTQVDNRELYYPELTAGSIQVVPEYVGTLATFINGQVNGPEANESDPPASGDLDATVTNLTTLGEGVGLVFGEPSEAQDQNAFAVTQELADSLGVATLSELAEACGDGSLILGGPPECPERPFCQPGLEETYGMSFGSVEDIDLGAPTVEALKQGEVSIGLVLSTDPNLAGG
ncbi:MAG: glycine/betaine ABC transporter substrate-binding protein [Geodermatophilaceae bacterium]|nr:glycine/betaine ABC transporter substrate-binding protein [Geodermatophilaceae bacterium]